MIGSRCESSVRRLTLTPHSVSPEPDVHFGGVSDDPPALRCPPYLPASLFSALTAAPLLP